MILTRSLRMAHEQHVVVPLERDPPGGLRAFATLVRVQTTVEPAGRAGPQWVVWPVPNAHSASSAWHIEEVAVEDRAFEHRALSDRDPVLEWRRPARWVAAASFDELMVKVPWDTVIDRRATFDADVGALQAQYGDEFAFVAAEFPGPGDYQLGWRWVGYEARACAAWFGTPPDRRTVVVYGVDRVRWARSALGGGEPEQQRQTHPRGHRVVEAARCTTASVAVDLMREERWNTDLVAPGGQSDGPPVTCSVV
jgi:hypothetical protein